MLNSSSTAAKRGDEGEAEISQAELTPPLEHIGYNSVGGGGINNQKMALIGLFLTAYENKASLSLPDITLMDQVNKAYDRISFDTVFIARKFLAAARLFNLSIMPYEPENLPHGYDKYFWKTNNLFEHILPNTANASTELTITLLACFEPRLRKSYIFEKLTSDIFGRDKGLVATQFRIEADWEKHCRTNLDINLQTPEDNYLPAEKIVEKILNTLPTTKTILAICDEPALPTPKNVIKEAIHNAFGVNMIFKSDFLSQFEISLLRPTYLSLLDFELARQANIFVGLSRSTFSNMLALQTFAEKHRDIENHYIYNLKNTAVVLRNDNGCHSDPAKATAAREMSNSGVSEMMTWRASQDTFLKKRDDPSWELDPNEKINIKSGDIVSGTEPKMLGGHFFLSNATLNGVALENNPWGFFIGHWQRN